MVMGGRWKCPKNPGTTNVPRKCLVRACGDWIDGTVGARDLGGLAVNRK